MQMSNLEHAQSPFSARKKQKNQKEIACHNQREITHFAAYKY